MITDRLNAWKDKKEMYAHEIDENLIGSFLEDEFPRPYECFKALAYAIHELEVCVDGLIEDMELLYGQKN